MIKLDECGCKFNPEKGEFIFCKRCQPNERLHWEIPIIALTVVILYMLFCFFGIPFIFGLN